MRYKYISVFTPSLWKTGFDFVIFIISKYVFFVCIFGVAYCGVTPFFLFKVSYYIPDLQTNSCNISS
jgi:hypothetical protein